MELRLLLTLCGRGISPVYQVGGVPLPVCQLGPCRAAIDSGISLVTNP